MVRVDHEFRPNWHHFSTTILPYHSRFDHSARNVPRVLYILLDESYRGSIKPVFRMFLAATFSSDITQEVNFVIPRRVSIAEGGKVVDFSFFQQDYFAFSTSQPMHQRFVRSSQVPFEAGAEWEVTNARFLGSFGKDAHFLRGTYFTAELDGDATMRSSFHRVCGIRAPETARNSSKVLLYQRNFNRRFLEPTEWMREIERVPSPFGNGNFHPEYKVHTDEEPPCVLANTLKDVYAVLTPHGFQTLVLLFMPRDSLIFEIFPYKYSKDNRYAYCGLAREYNVRYGMMLSEATGAGGMLLKLVPYPTCHQYYHCRLFARDHDVRMTPCGFDYFQRLLSNPEMHGDEASCPRLTRAEDWDSLDSKGTCTMVSWPQAGQQAVPVAARSSGSYGGGAGRRALRGVWGRGVNVSTAVSTRPRGLRDRVSAALA